MSAKIDSLQEEVVGGNVAELPARKSGMIADQAKDNVYMAVNGFIYTSPWCTTKSTTRFSASILLTAKRAPFELTIEGQTSSHQAVTIRPVCERGLRAENVRLISVQVNPFHPMFRRFRTIPSPGYLSLDREAFTEFDEALDLAYWSKLNADAGAQLLEDVIARTTRYLPKAKRADPRIERALAMLQENPNYPLKDLAGAIGLSYDRMSHLFAEVVGLPLRSYLLWLKIHAAALLRGSGLTLTEIADAAGFNDSAHLCNTWQQAFGKSPSSFFVHADYIKVHTAKQVKERFPIKLYAAPKNKPVAATAASPEKQAKVCHHCGSRHPHES